MFTVRKKSLTGIVFLTTALALFFTPSFSAADTIKIGLRAHIGIEKSMQQWKKTADYLSEKIPEHKFIMIPLVSLPKLLQETGKNKFDFVLTNPSSFVEMEVRFGASPILTLRNKRQGKPYSLFGSVIFTKKENDSINEIKDLKDKKIIAVSETAFGGWRVAWRELLKEGFDPYKQAKQINFSGGIQQDVVNIVSLGNADVGVVRTDMLERLANKGVIRLQDFKVINAKSNKNFPFYHSTQLYPEWSFTKVRTTSSELSKKVALALLTMPAEHPAAIAGKYVGWTVPEDYQPVHDLMKELKVGPFHHHNEHIFEHLLEEYLYHFIISIFVFIGLVSLTVYIIAINRKLVGAKVEQDKLFNELEDRVNERTRDLLEAKIQADRANNSKSEFLSNMSHELRTPLNAILGFAQILEIDLENKSIDSAEDSVNEILRAGRFLNELVNDVLDFSKIEAGEYELDIKPVAIGRTINDVIRLLQTVAREKQITLTVKFDDEDELEIYADQRSLKQVLINLVSNAIKYNHVGGNVDIIMTSQNDGYCKVSVIDTGYGIAEELLVNIFDPFQRVSNRTDISGSGVGLSVTKKLVEMMDGKITVESKLEQGSTFSVMFKLVNQD